MPRGNGSPKLSKACNSQWWKTNLTSPAKKKITPEATATWGQGAVALDDLVGRLDHSAGNAGGAHV